MASMNKILVIFNLLTIICYFAHYCNPASKKLTIYDIKSSQKNS